MMQRELKMAHHYTELDPLDCSTVVSLASMRQTADSKAEGGEMGVAHGAWCHVTVCREKRQSIFAGISLRWLSAPRQLPL